jgi:tRNA(Arg) A34 adenosine deaminase TadA
MRAHEHASLNHRIEVSGGVLAAESREVMQAFFRDRRRDDA